MKLRATVMHTPTRDEVECLNDVLIEVEDGTIVSIRPGVDETVDLELPPDHVLVPGFIDLHVHAPQWPQLGTGYDLPLSEWLFEYTFPLEARFSDLDFAQQTWDTMVPALLAHGTTTAVYYGSIHTPATTALAETCIRHGQRAWVGRVAMDHPDGTPEWYRDAGAAEALEATRESIAQIYALDDPHGLVNPVITPRFIPACTDELLFGLGALAEETGVIVQTHCSEDDWEHHHVLERTDRRDTAALDHFGLLRESTVLGHGVHLNATDFSTIRERDAGVAHCPLSNVYFGNAVFPAAHALDAGVHVGLGTDIAGGPSASVLANAAIAINSSRMLEDGVEASLQPNARGTADSRITATTSFWMATMGGAEVLNQQIGLIQEGRRFDAVSISLAELAPASAGYSPERRFEQLVRLAGRHEITDVWVDGCHVIGDL